MFQRVAMTTMSLQLVLHGCWLVTALGRPACQHLVASFADFCFQTFRTFFIMCLPPKDISDVRLSVGPRVGVAYDISGHVELMSGAGGELPALLQGNEFINCLHFIKTASPPMESVSY